MRPIENRKDYAASVNLDPIPKIGASSRLTCYHKPVLQELTRMEMPTCYKILFLSLFLQRSVLRGCPFPFCWSANRNRTTSTLLCVLSFTNIWDYFLLSLGSQMCGQDRKKESMLQAVDLQSACSTQNGALERKAILWDSICQPFSF